MFDEPHDVPSERHADPAMRAREKADELRMHAEIAAAMEGARKFDAQLRTGLDYAAARDVQARFARLARARSPESPVLPAGAVADAAAMLDLHATLGLALHDYHVHRRPGELIVVRWLQGARVDEFFDRFQAHFDAALADVRDDVRQTHGWKQDPATQGYLAALDAVSLRMADVYLRDAIRKLGVVVLSTVTADEINIRYLAEDVMGLSIPALTGVSAQPALDEPTDADLAWFFKLFALRGIRDGVEQMCFLAYLQKTDDSFDAGA